jgi:flavin-dependent dehydrogenase
VGHEAISVRTAAITTDVAVVGGGPAGATVGTLLNKYAPRLRVSIFERERFPRDHVGESQLPIIGQVLDEMGCWEKVEAANFPIKVGATYRWGRTDDLWDFHFLQNGELRPEPRPAKYQGQRRRTAFQVDRSVYDKILLDHAAATGCDIRQECGVRSVETSGGRIAGLLLEDGTEVTARWYVDASGHAGIMRRALGLEVECPTALHNIAIWDYWQNADWMDSVGVGGTRIVIISVGYGWLWFIPLSPTRTSVGLVVPAAYYKESGKRPEELYSKAVHEAPKIGELLRNASREGNLSTTKDWSFVTRRIAGENWFLAGESAGFADPILSAGMSLAHVGGRDVAYCIVAAERGDYDRDWLSSWYDENHRRAIAQHIRFADFWYGANGCFTDLIEYTAQIAQSAGLDLSPEEAWQWLGTGGFVDHNVVGAGYGGYTLRLAKQISGNFLGTGPRYVAGGKNVFYLNMDGVQKDWGARLHQGRILRHRAYRRGERLLPDLGLYSLIIRVTRHGGTAQNLFDTLMEKIREGKLSQAEASQFVNDAFDAVEAMIADGWLVASRDESQPSLESPPDDLSIVGPRLVTT